MMPGFMTKIYDLRLMFDFCVNFFDISVVRNRSNVEIVVTICIFMSEIEK